MAGDRIQYSESMGDEMNRSKLWEAVCWFFIIGVVILVQSETFRSMTDTPSDSTPDIAIHRIGKYYVGVKQLLANNPGAMQITPQLGQTFERFQRNGTQLSSIPVLAELSGRDTALKELERMSANPDTIRNAKDLPVFQKLYREGSDALDSDERLVLERYGWIGELALSQDKPDTNPERQAVLKSAAGMVVKIVLTIMAVIACFLGGLVLFIISIVFWFKGRIPTRLVMPEYPARSLLESFTVYLVGSTIIPYLILTVAPGFGIGAMIIQILFILFPIPWLFIRGASWKGCREALGWHIGQGPLREIGAGILGCITGLPLVFCAFVVVTIMVQRTGIIPYHPVVEHIGSSPIRVLFLACVFAPVVEETLFRGALFGYLRRSFSWVISGIISGLIFAAIHPQGWVAVPLLCTIGFIFAAIREWRGSIIASMTAHSMINGIAVLMTLAGM